MQCFTHHEKPAVGLCKCCGKGLCADCAVDLGEGLACSSHKDNVAEMIELVNNSKKINKGGRVTTWIISSFFIVLGAIYVGIDLFANEHIDYFTLSLGGILMLFGMVILIRNLRIYKK